VSGQTGHAGPRASGGNGRANGSGRRGEAYAALDLGTNNCRLLIARPYKSAFRVLDAFSRTVRLGEGVERCGVLTPHAMDRALTAISICAEKIRRRGVTRFRAIATQACREARNGRSFAGRVQSETGIPIEIITPQEEARLAAVGCMPLLDRDCDLALVFDIGGGSTELIWLDVSGTRGARRPEILAWTSLPCGVMTLAERYGNGRIPKEAYPRMVADVSAGLAPFRDAEGLGGRLNGARLHTLGPSGTVTTLAGVSLGLEKYDRSRVDGAWLEGEEVRALCARLSAMDFEERASAPCIGPDRANLVLAGCAILEAIHSQWPSPRLRVADRGLREGILIDLMRGGGTNRHARPPAGAPRP
jgi:exopolyphosphatase / guanosine-5'-triphosphate,3'-diphosphate pyrophosphatase